MFRMKYAFYRREIRFAQKSRTFCEPLYAPASEEDRKAYEAALASLPYKPAILMPSFGTREYFHRACELLMAGFGYSGWLLAWWKAGIETRKHSSQ